MGLGQRPVPLLAPAFPQPLPPGSLSIPGYEILGELGRGGMGVVYQARQTQLKRTVALKMLLAGNLANEQQKARFRIEAELVAGLRHPNIVQVYEVGEYEGRPFIAFEYVEGGNLDHLLTGQPVQPHTAAELMEVLAGTMAAAHQKGIVHRDLKPANILLAADPRRETQRRKRWAGGAWFFRLC
jgi:serine/threonine protein kinase